MKAKRYAIIGGERRFFFVEETWNWRRKGHEHLKKLMMFSRIDT